jgi:hypothetical protein
LSSGAPTPADFRQFFESLPDPAEFISNLDEIGLSDWEERKPKPILVPVSEAAAQLYCPVDRQIRH